MAISCSALGKQGRLGNQLFQIASVVGAARRLGEQPFLIEWDYRPYFNVPDEWFQVPMGRVREAAKFMSDRVHPDQRSYLQDWEMIADVEDELREAFRPSQTAIAILDDHLEVTGQTWLRSLPDETISLHVRRGDNTNLKTHPIGTWPLPTAEYYDAALKLMPDSPDVPVIVFSDDIPWCENNLHVGSNVKCVKGGPQRSPEYGLGAAYYDEPPMDWIDLQLMTLCKHHILSNSTYSWWGAFLGEKQGSITTYPNHWVGWRIPQFDHSVLMPSHWIEVNNPVHERHLVEGR